MTVREIHRKVRTQFQSVAAQTLDNFLPEEIDHYVNRAVRQYVNQLRPSLRRQRNTPREDEAQDKLRTLIDTETFTDTDADFSGLPSLDRGQSVDLSEIQDYEYFIAARLSASEYRLNCRLTTLPEFYEHAPTEENTPVFREPVIAEVGDNLWIMRPSNHAASPETLFLTYLRHPQKISSVMQVKIDVSAGSGSTDPAIQIGPENYTVAFDKNRLDSVDTFVTNKGPQIRQETGLTVEGEGGTIVITGYNSRFKTDQIVTDMPGDESLTLNKTETTSQQSLDLPEDTHQNIVDQTVALLKRDLPQAQSNQQAE